MGKAIRNFKDALSGVEEANYRKIDDTPKKPEAISEKSATAATEIKTEQKSEENQKT